MNIFSPKLDVHNYVNTHKHFDATRCDVNLFGGNLIIDEGGVISIFKKRFNRLSA